MPHTPQITVFGGTGFIGRHVVRRLAKTGAIIRIPTREPEKALLLKPMGDIGKIVPIHCSTRSDASVANAIGPSDAVINLIGILYEKGANTFQTIHVETAARIARLAKEAGAQRFTHMSALGASDTSPSTYARSKMAGEQAVRMFFADTAVIRPSLVFGPEDNFFNLFAKLTRFSPALPLIGGGTTKFQPVYAGDVAEAIARTLEQSDAGGMNYELGGPQIYSFRELMELMLRQIDRKRLLLNLSWSMAKFQAAFLEHMPKPMLTRDQIELLKTDNVLRSAQNGLRALGVSPTALEFILPTYLDRFRKDFRSTLMTPRKPKAGDKENDSNTVTPHTNVAVKTKPATKKPSMYKVLLLNDDYTPMEFVVQVLETFFNKSREDATRIMMHVHQKGVGLCGVFTYEVAETKVSQVMAAARQAQHPLQCTMEKE